MYSHSEQPAVSSWWRMDVSCALSVHFYQTTQCHILGDRRLKWLMIWEPLLALLFLFDLNGNCILWKLQICLQLEDEKHWTVDGQTFVCSFLATSINLYGSANADMCVVPFHTVHHFLLLVYNSEAQILHSLSPWFLIFYASAAKTSVRRVLYFCDTYICPLIPQLYIQLSINWHVAGILSNVHTVRKD
jgi:hypothetical protein